MLGVGRKPPSVLRQHSTKRPTCEQSGQLIPLFGLAPGADWHVSSNPIKTSTTTCIIALFMGCVVSDPLQRLSPLLLE